jgi:hypothetical protein
MLIGCLYHKFRHLQHKLLLNAHLNQHYNKDEDSKLGHGSAVGGYDNVVSCVSVVLLLMLESVD